MPALLVALALTLTQNAWIGTIVALGCLVAIRQVKLLLLAPLVLGLAFLIAPGEVRSRVANGLSPQTESNRDRIQMLGMGADIVRDHPVFGVGPLARQAHQSRLTPARLLAFPRRHSRRH
jgi:O-antigen ligase